jgi:hypothetical protein
VDPDVDGVAGRGGGEVDEATKETDMSTETLRWWLSAMAAAQSISSTREIMVPGARWSPTALRRGGTVKEQRMWLCLPYRVFASWFGDNTGDAVSKNPRFGVGKKG